MCEPTTIALVAAVAISAVSAYSSAEAQKNQAEYQSKVAKNNAKVAEWQAADAKARGDQEAANVRRKYAALQGTQAASLAARGLDISEGSANAILTDTDFFSAYDQNVTRSNAEREAWGHKVRAGNFAGDAAYYGSVADAQNPLLSGVLAGAQTYFGMGGYRSKAPAGQGTDLMGSATSVDPSWYG
jgi:hypothetical protein